MEEVKILAVDASLRNTGLCVVTYNTELSPEDSAAYKVSNAQVLVNPQKYKGTDAILNMLDMLSDQSKKECYQKIDNVLVESPPVMFNKTWGAGTISSIAHISGGAVVVFGIEKSHLFRPGEWNKNRKKDITHARTVDFLGDPNSWHYEYRVKSESLMEHILDAASMALWFIKSTYVEE